MAPFPEEVDVFRVPHSRMKELVDKYYGLIKRTDYGSGYEFQKMLRNLSSTFLEFKAHEAIENELIMTKLKQKLKALSIKNTAVCNCHNDNRLSEMIGLFKDGYRWMDKSERERQNYALKVKQELEVFTSHFVPHMKEEEEVFQPLLIKYFTTDELKQLKQQVIIEHLKREEAKYKEEVKEVKTYKDSCYLDDSDSEEEFEEVISEKTDVIKNENVPKIPSATIKDLPPEVMLKVFSYLNPKELSRCSQVNKQFSDISMDCSLWQEILPVKWAQGEWNFQSEQYCTEDEDETFEEKYDEEEKEYFCIDDDKDIDESEGSDCISDDDSNDTENMKEIQRESKLLLNFTKYILPKIGKGVKTLNLGYSRGVTNGLLIKMLNLCPNIEFLDVSQTRISDLGFSGFGSTFFLPHLKKLSLSGCENISDNTLIRFGKAMLENTGLKPNKNMKNAIFCPKIKIGEPIEDIFESSLDCDHCDYYQYCYGSNERKCCYKFDGAVMNSANLNTIQNGMKILQPSIQPSVNWFVKQAKPNKFFENDLPKKRDKNDAGVSNGCDGKDIFLKCGFRNDQIPNINSNGAKDNFCSKPNENAKKLVFEDVQGDRDKDDVDDDVLSDVTTQQQKVKLEYLNLSGCHKISDEGIRALCIPGGLPNLYHLDLSGCLKLGAKTLSDLVDLSPKLDDELFFYCDNIIDGPRAETASGCQNLFCGIRSCCRK